MTAPAHAETTAPAVAGNAQVSTEKMRAIDLSQFALFDFAPKAQNCHHCPQGYPGCEICD